MSVTVAIDTREPALQEMLRDYHDRHAARPGEGSIEITTEPLDIGDVQIRCGAEHKIIIERKSCVDLVGSIKDGRYREQKVRLLAGAAVPNHVCYILEGVPSMQQLLNTDVFLYGLKPSVISGMMVHTMLRDGVHVINVKNTQETAAWIWTIVCKCASSPEKVFGAVEQPRADAGNSEGTGTGAAGAGAGGGYLQNVTVKVKKSDNITPESCYLMQLCQVPGVSVTTANGIAAKYPTMHNLLCTLSGLEDVAHRIKCLSEIPMIGKKKAQVILDYLLPA